MTMDPTQKNNVMHRADWISLRDYVDTRIEALCRAVDKAEQTLNARLAGMNEFRETLRDQAGKFVTREEVQLMLKPIADDVKGLLDFASRHEGKASQTSVLVTAAIAVASLVVSILSRLLGK